MASDDKPDRPIQFHRRDTSRLDAALRRPNTDSNVTDKNGIDISRIPSPSSKSGVRPRRTFGKTSTLTGAFEATAPQQQQQQQQSPVEPDHDRGRVTRGTPSPSSRRVPGRSQSSTIPAEDISSPPELQETYRQINESDQLINLVAQDDFDQLEVSNPTQEDQRQRRSPNQRSLYRRSPSQRSSSSSKRSSSQRMERQVEEQQHSKSHEDPHEPERQGSGLSFPDDDTDDSFQKKLEMHAMDEQRLKRVTTRDSPVFSKAKVGQNASLTAGNFQRRNDEGNDERLLGEDGPEPALNIPKAWGERGQSSKERMSHISRRNLEPPVEKPQNIKPEPGPEPETEPVQDWDDLDFTARDLQVSDSPPVEQNFAQEGDAIPNTPIVVYKDHKKYDKFERTDSREFLRKLALRESPNPPSPNPPNSNTPEQKPPEKNVMLAKTPVVTGAWIDTPMTERVADLPEDLTKDIVSPRPSRGELKAEKQEEKPPANPSSQPPSEPASQRTATEPSAKPSSKPRRHPLQKPNVPKSALETVLENAKSDDNTLSFGEDTIDSLQGILNEDPSIFSPNTETESDGTSLSEQAATNANNLAIGSLDPKLQSLIRSIHDAQKGLSSLERQITSEGEKKKQKRVKSSETTHDVSTCETCGPHGHEQRLYVGLPRLWKRQPSNRVRPTLLGYSILIFITWFLVEFTLCDIYCHPLYAYSCKGNCIRPNAPRYPFVLPTMLWRWSRLETLLAPLWVVAVAVGRFALQVCGLSDGFAEDRVRRPHWGDIPHRQHLQKPVSNNEAPVMPSWRRDIPTQETNWDDGRIVDDDYI